ncbi:hypothetical protein [Holdemania sp. Marseille-P2844]|uniref:hypothetical protein n=1 Tax=Holdemania sp. Marseille-P2844 TaxID=1852366 RepID=UPI0009333EC4|nr:hypothetical protein [Holdemania sp. Marseille-P2844]
MLFGEKGGSKSSRLIINSGYMYNLTSDSTGYEILNTSNNPYFQPWGNIFGTGASPTFNGTSIGATLKLPYDNKIPLTMQLSGTNTNSWKLWFSEDGVSFEEIYSGGSGTVYIPFDPGRKVKYIKFTASGTSQMKENKVLVRQWVEFVENVGSKYEVVNLFDARQSPGSVSGSKTFEKPVYVDNVYMSWFRSFSDYKATVTVIVTLEDGTQQTIYSVTNSGAVGGENAVLKVNRKIKSIKFELISGSVSGNGIGYQVTFVALK